MAHNKYLILRLEEDNESLSAKSAAQILSLNLAQTFLLLNFLITGLCNSPSSSSFTLAPYPVFFSKSLQTILANPLGYPSCLEFLVIS